MIFISYYNEEDTLLKKYDYSIKQLMKIIFIENPDIEKDECYKKALFLKKEIDKLNKQINYNTKRYFEHNIPLSSFENEDGEYEF